MIGTVIGYHGCEKSIARDVLLGRASLVPSTNSYDWLGSGIYFWENDPIRALEFASEVKQCSEPFVIGAVMDLGYCLDLTMRENLISLQVIWEKVVKPVFERGEIKVNRPGRRGETGELMLRHLDCYTIESLHKFNEAMRLQSFDSVRAGFWEGNELYPTAGFFDKNHIQICVRNPQSIIGYFLPKGYIL